MAEKEDLHGITPRRLYVAGVAGLRPATTLTSCTQGIVFCSRKESRAANPAGTTSRYASSMTAVERSDERKPGGCLSYLQDPLTPYFWMSLLKSASLVSKCVVPLRSVK